MAREAQRRVSAAVAALTVLFLLALPAGAPAAGAAAGDRQGQATDDRPPPHASDGDAPPPHASSPAPEDRPPAHAQARRASARPRAGRSASGAGGPPPSGGSGRPAQPVAEAAPRPAPRPPMERPPATEGPDRPGRGIPAGGRPADVGGGAEVPAPGTELDADGVVAGPRPDRDRAPTAVGGPVLPASTVTTPGIIGPGPVAPPVGFGDTDARAIAPVGPIDPIDPIDPIEDGTPPAGSDPREDELAGPSPHDVPPVFTAEATERVVVPLAVLVAVLAYLLVQGRIDRRGELLIAPVTPGTEQDDVVFHL